MDSDMDNMDIVESSTPRTARPLWRYVTKIGEGAKSGGNVAFTCNFCHLQYVGSYSRVKAHLLKIGGRGISKCPKVTTAELHEMLKLESESSRSSAGPVPCNSSQASSDVYGSAMVLVEESGSRKKRITGQRRVDAMFNMQQKKEELDAECARFFYSSGLKFHLADDHYFKEFFSLLGASSVPGYVIPSPKELCTKLLKKERARIESLLLHTRSEWRTKGVSILCNGWSNPQRRPVIDFMVVNEDGSMFLKSVNCEDSLKDAAFIATLMDDVISDVGAENVVHVIIDNASVCQAVGVMSQHKYPQIFWTPCVIRALDLALKNICAPKDTESNMDIYSECVWISKIITTVTLVKDFVVDHSMIRAIIMQFPRLRLLFIADSRFASGVVKLKRFKRIMSELKAMVISNEWSSYHREDEEKARLVRDNLLDQSFWASIDYILAFTQPIYDMMRACDTEKPSLHLVHPMWLSMMSRVKSVIFEYEKKNFSEISSFWNAVFSVLERRRKEAVTPVHALAHSLNPMSTTAEWQEQHPELLQPIYDPEISNLRKECLKSCISDEDSRTKVNMEFAKFLSSSAEFREEDSKKERSKLDPMDWWVVHGASAPHLQCMANRLLRQVSSSSGCMRNWGTYKLIRAAELSTSGSQHVKDLVFVHNNLRLLSRKRTDYGEGESRFWDVFGDEHELAYTGGLFEVACLSFDEPDFEEHYMKEEEEMMAAEESMVSV